MKYYDKNLVSTVTPDLEISIYSEQFSDVQNKLKNNFNLQEIKNLSKTALSLVPFITGRIFFLNSHNTFENFYKLRFILNEEEFCQLQKLLFSYSTSKGGECVVPHLETFFNSLFKTIPVLLIPPEYLERAYDFYDLAIKSQSIDFYQSYFSNSDFKLLNLNEHKNIKSFSIELNSFCDFFKFAQHTAIFNYFKEFLMNPKILLNPLSSTNPFFNLVSHLSLEDNTNPRLDELSTFAKLMEQSHWDTLTTLHHNSLYGEFLEKVFFYPSSRVNSSSGFFSQTLREKKMIHWFRYDVLDVINEKNIDLSDLFTVNKLFPDFESFVLTTIEKKMKYSNENSEGSDLIYDEQGLEHIYTSLKPQNYFKMNKRLKAKGIVQQNTKI